MIQEYLIKLKLVKFCKDKQFQLPSGRIPKISNIQVSKYGFSFNLDTSGICSENEILNNKNYIKTLFKAIDCYIVYNKILSITLITNEETNLGYQIIDLPNTKLLVGHSYNGDHIIIDMLKTPHVGVVGTSTSGKSKCVWQMLKNLKQADITLINCFSDDFTDINATRVTGNKQILESLRNLNNINYKLKRPLYVVIDEYNVLNNIKGVDKLIQDLLSQARHFNIYVICIMQIGNKEDCRFKNLFNTRIAFRTLEQQTLSAFLGISETLPVLNDRYFYLVHTKLEKGKTFNLLLN